MVHDFAAILAAIVVACKAGRKRSQGHQRCIQAVICWLFMAFTSDVFAARTKSQVCRQISVSNGQDNSSSVADEGLFLDEVSNKIFHDAIDLHRLATPAWTGGQRPGTAYYNPATYAQPNYPGGQPGFQQQQTFQPQYTYSAGPEMCRIRDTDGDTLTLTKDGRHIWVFVGTELSVVNSELIAFSPPERVYLLTEGQHGIVASEPDYQRVLQFLESSHSDLMVQSIPQIWVSREVAWKDRWRELEGQRQSLEQQIEELKRGLQSRYDVEADLRARVDRLRQSDWQRQVLEHDIEELKSESRDLQQQTQRYRQTIATLQSQLQQKDRELEKQTARGADAQVLSTEDLAKQIVDHELAELRSLTEANKKKDQDELEAIKKDGQKRLQRKWHPDRQVQASDLLATKVMQDLQPTFA